MARIRKSNSRETTVVRNVVWKIALYLRLSKDDGSDESLSVRNQKKILMEFLEKHFQEEYVIADIYTDDGRTGTDYDRPEFQRMIHDIEIGMVNCIICKNLSRAFRNYSDQGYFLENFFPLHNTRFITLGDPKIDTFLNPEAVNGLEIPINGLMNDRFAYKTSSDIRRTFDTKRRNGEFIGAFAPYGYQKHPQNKNVLLIDDEAAQVVRDIFRWFVYGGGGSKAAADDRENDQKALTGSMSKEGIARRLNELGIPNPTLYKKIHGLKYKNPHARQNDGLWIAGTVSRILQNKTYIGTMVQGKQKVISYKVHDIINVPEEEWYQVENTHEAIIPAELFEMAQKLQKRDTRTAPGKKENYLFAGFLKCADCKKSMTRHASKNYVYYNCSTYKRKSKDRCTRHTMRLDILEEAVLRTIQKQIELALSLERVAEGIGKDPGFQAKPAHLEQLLDLRVREYERIENRFVDLYIDWKNGDITHDQYWKMKMQFEQQQEQLRKTMEHIQEQMDAMERRASDDASYIQIFLKHGNIRELSQELLTELVEVIYIHENGEITIQFKCKDPYKCVAGLIGNRKSQESS